MTPPNSLRLYRWAVLLLAGGYSIYYIVTSDYSNFGGTFRKLSFWALFLSFFSASRMIAVMEGRSTRPHDVTAMVTAVANLMVVFLYWRLCFDDPALVHDSGAPDNWVNNIYIHLVGPALQIFDALFLKRAFRRPFQAVAPLMGFVATYVLWGELVLQNFSEYPTGIVTSGLPYQFLNGMDLSARATFYFQNFAVALGFLGLLWLIAWLYSRLNPYPAVGS